MLMDEYQGPMLCKDPAEIERYKKLHPAPRIHAVGSKACVCGRPISANKLACRNCHDQIMAAWAQMQAQQAEAQPA